VRQRGTAGSAGLTLSIPRCTTWHHSGAACSGAMCSQIICQALACVQHCTYTHMRTHTHVHAHTHTHVHTHVHTRTHVHRLDKAPQTSSSRTTCSQPSCSSRGRMGVWLRWDWCTKTRTKRIILMTNSVCYCVCTVLRGLDVWLRKERREALVVGLCALRLLVVLCAPFFVQSRRTCGML